MSVLEETERRAAGHAAVLDYYGLREEPFGVTPDPRFLYFSPSHREALASLVYTTQTKRGFSALVAEPGMGKTTLLFHLLEKIKGTARTAFLFRPDRDSRDLLQSLLADLGVDAIGQTIPEMHENLSSVLLEEQNLGREFVWVVDEAQDLDASVLETIRTLSNFETPSAKLMHIILAGQPALADKLARPELLQLRQRVSRIAHLAPFSPRETSEYIAHRLRLCGCKERTLFESDTVRAIAKASHGIPRNINNLCFACLSLGFVERVPKIGLHILRAVLEDCEPETPAAKTDSPPPPHLPPPPERIPSSRSWYEQDIDALRSNIRSGYAAQGSHFWVGLVLIGLVFIPFGLLVAQANSSSRQFDVSPIDALVARLTGYDLSMPDPPLSNAPALRPPRIPPNLADLIQEAPHSESGIQEPDAFDTPQAPEKTPAETAAAEKTPAPAATRVSSHRPPPAPQSYGRRVVRADRDQTIFQLAERYYGKANWSIVTKIRASNPAMREPFPTIRKGQRVVLPDILVE